MHILDLYGRHDRYQEVVSSVSTSDALLLLSLGILADTASKRQGVQTGTDKDRQTDGQTGELRSLTTLLTTFAPEESKTQSAIVVPNVT